MGEVPSKRCPEVEARVRVVIDETKRWSSTLLIFPGREVKNEVGVAEHNVSALELQKFAYTCSDGAL